MAGIKLAKRQAQELSYNNYTIDDVETIDAQPFATYHDPKTGQEFYLPADTYSLSRYRARGYVLGSASEELRQKYATRETVRGELKFLSEETQTIVTQDDLLALVLELKQEIQSLRAKSKPEVAATIEPTEPVQLRLL